MFRYLEKHSWWVTLEEKQVATIEELIKLCKQGEVERVIIPNTYYGYGSSLVDDSNIRSIQAHYPRARFKMVQYNLTMSASQFLRNADYREFIEELLEQNPVFDEQDHSNLESETQLEFLVDELLDVLLVDDSQLEVNWTKKTILETLEAGEWDTRIEWWDYVEIDNDGATPYATKENIAHLAAILKTKGPTSYA